jgi:hypothetical protein
MGKTLDAAARWESYVRHTLKHVKGLKVQTHFSRARHILRPFLPNSGKARTSSRSSRGRANNQDLSKIILPYAGRLVTHEAGLCNDALIVYNCR